MIEELHWVLANFISYFAECSLNSQWNRKAFLFIFASTDIFVWKRRDLEYISNNKKVSLEQKNVKEIKEKPTQKSIEICERNREYQKLLSSTRKIFFVLSIKEKGSLWRGSSITPGNCKYMRKLNFFIKCKT